MKIAYVLYPDFTALDLVGPYEVISRWPDAEVHFLARSLEPVRADCGLTVIPTGQTVDLLLDVTNPGLWMAHCHIAEHMHSGMMFSFTVDRAATS